MFKTVNNKIKLPLKWVRYLIILSSTIISGQQQSESQFTRLLDSAYKHVEINSSKSFLFLDSIRPPYETKLKGRLADFYYLKALIQSENGDYAQVYSNYILALNYAEKEKNYRVGGMSCIELFSNIYFVNKDSTAYKYLDKAKDFYTRANFKNGLIEIDQMHAYVKYLDHDYLGCNKMLLAELDNYKKITNDAYYYMFALYMLTENYIKLQDFNKARENFNKFKLLKNNKTIAAHNYYAFEIGINLTYGNYYLKKGEIDSSTVYINKVSKLRRWMDTDLMKEYYTLKSDYYKYTKNLDQAKFYLDSLTAFENKLFKNMIDASFHLNKPLLNAESNLDAERSKTDRYGLLAIVLVCLMSFSGVVYAMFYKKQKLKINDYSQQIDNYSFLKTNNDKLTGKVKGLEDYILNLKSEIKEITSIHEQPEQKERIKELYKTVLVNSSTIINKSEDHLELVNELNVNFFKQIKQKHPELNDSEIITCYYLFMGFKNKEIALFLNISVRALESKRYRISKKLKINTQKTSLLEHLENSFGALKA